MAQSADGMSASKKRNTRGSIGDMSAAIGYDVRDLAVAGYSWDQIREVVAGRMSLSVLMRSTPENEPIDTKEIPEKLLPSSL